MASSNRCYVVHRLDTVIQAEVYDDRRENCECETTFKLGEDDVIRQIAVIETSQQYEFEFDNYFTSIEMIKTT